MNILPENKHKQLALPAPSAQALDEHEDWLRVIRSLNDAFRLSFTATELYCSPGIIAFSLHQQGQILERVRNYRNFNEENDPDKLHNRGSFDFEGQTILWEIYCTDQNQQNEASDPACLKLTRRHMMILIENE